jgi:hypothetical protein
MDSRLMSTAINAQLYSLSPAIPPLPPPPSHGYTHAVSVSSNASEIMRLSPQFPELPFTDLPPADIVKVAAMLHGK